MNSTSKPVVNVAAVLAAIKHGGDVAFAARQWGSKPEHWVDLSTAISPFIYPLPTPPKEIWQSLPYDRDGFVGAAQKYYGVRDFIALSGSQQAIELLPELFAAMRVAVPACGYSEHREQWARRGHELVLYESFSDLRSRVDANQVDIVVVINPNNPTGEQVGKTAMLQLASDLAKQGAWLIVDEAFIDCWPEHSLAACALPNVIVLRSLGKFFGLAGIRLGFVFAPHFIRRQLRVRLSLWQIPGPSLWAAELALADSEWQKHQRLRLKQAGAALLEQLKPRFPGYRLNHHSLFVSVVLNVSRAQGLFARFAEAGILLRYIPLNDKQAMLRFGLLPESKSAHQRFSQVLKSLPRM